MINDVDGIVGIVKLIRHGKCIMASYLDWCFIMHGKEYYVEVVLLLISNL